MTAGILALIDEAVADWATSPDVMRHIPDLPPDAPVPQLPKAWFLPVPTPEQVVADDLRIAVYAWLVANRLGEPRVRVPLDAKASIIHGGRTIACEVYQTRDGEIMVDETRMEIPPYLTVWAPLRVPPKDPQVWVWLGKPRGVPPPLGRRLKRSRRGGCA